MAKTPKTYAPEPDDEPDAEPAAPEEAEDAATAVEPELAPTQQTVAQNDTHKQAVTTATGSKQSSLAAAAAAYKSGGTLATFISSVKSADIAYYQAIVSSAQAQAQPVGGAIDALKQLGAF